MLKLVEVDLPTKRLGPKKLKWTDDTVGIMWPFVMLVITQERA